MRGAACVGRGDRALVAVPGVRAVHVDALTGIATLTAAPGARRLAVAAIKAAGDGVADDGPICGPVCGPVCGPPVPWPSASKRRR